MVTTELLLGGDRMPLEGQHWVGQALVLVGRMAVAECWHVAAAPWEVMRKPELCIVWKVLWNHSFLKLFHRTTES